MRAWKSTIMLTIVATSFAMSDPAWSQMTEPRKTEAERKLQKLIEKAASATVPIDEAVKTASEKVSGKVVDAELERKHNRVVWEVEVLTAENKVMEVRIDAETGAVIAVYDVEAEKAKSGRLRRPRS